jgi:LPXTG-site transpeptidase (sortase) family protein
MKKILLLFTIITLTISPVWPHKEADEVAYAQVPIPFPTANGVRPTRLIIPAIKLQDPVQNMGVTGNGELDVPNGMTKNVGWYAAGTLPGDAGSAVMDAHVYAAFVNLHKVKVGDDVYVQTDNGRTLRFVVNDVETYALASVPVDKLFNQDGARNLNLITCAGKFNKQLSTYDHRLVVYATLAQS